MKKSRNSPTDTGHFSFEFPTLVSDLALQNDVVFCGKVIIRQSTEPCLEDPVRSKFFSKPKPVRPVNRDQRWGSFQLPATRYSRLQRSSSSRRYSNGLFGVVKFPVQMELSDMKKRQSALLPKLATVRDDESEKGGGEKRACHVGETEGGLRKEGRIMVNIGGSYVEVFRDETLRVMREVFGEKLFVLNLGNHKDDSSLAITGD
ncbi:hypothetical protein E2542_SST28335 [Spatholobus suberectus]|nr:hypothetical protein E2542_SST28335 [Spatholobus suberectus]